MSENSEKEKRYEIIENFYQMEAYNRVKELLKYSGLEQKIEETKENVPEDSEKEKEKREEKEIRNAEEKKLLEEADIVEFDDEKIKIGLEVLADLKKIYCSKLENWNNERSSEIEELVIWFEKGKETQGKKTREKKEGREKKFFFDGVFSKIEKLIMRFKGEKNKIYLGDVMSRRETYESYARQISDILRRKILTYNVELAEHDVDDMVDWGCVMKGKDFYIDLIYEEGEGNLNKL